MTRSTAPLGYRKYHGWIQMAVHDYQNAAVERTITLVGTGHVASPKFYADLTEVIADREARGAVVHYEGVSTNFSVDDLSDAERSAVAASQRSEIGLLARVKAVGLDWVPQNVGLPPHAAWRNIDVSDLDVMRLVGPATITDAERAATTDPMPTTEEEAASTRERLVDYFNRYDEVYEAAAEAGTLLDRKVTLDWRNIVASLGALGETRDVVMIWGAIHLHGIGEYLERNGFVHRSTEWFTPIPASA